MIGSSQDPRQRRSIQARLLGPILILALMLGSVPAARAQGGGAPELFVDAAGAAADARRAEGDHIVRSRVVTVNLGLLFDQAGRARDLRANPEIALNLFPDASYVGVVNKVEKNVSGGDSWIGTLKGVDGYFYLVVADGVFISHVASPEGVYEVSWAGDGLYQVTQLDYSRMGDEPEVKYDPPGPVLTQADLGPQADTGALIDVMVIYTSAARVAEGSTAAMKARIALAMTETNTSYANAGIVPRLRLVHVQEMSYPETGDMQVDVNRLTNPADGFLDAVHALRNQYGADMVSLIVENGGTGLCGIAKTIMATAASAFDVTARSCTTGYYSFGHEFGHLQGARHDTYVDPTNTPYAFGHGYTHPSATPAESWRTVMGYNNACAAAGYDCTRLQYWSNPTKSYLGAAMGAGGSSENYKVLNATAFTVANFRANRIGANFYSPFTSNSTGWASVSGAWTRLSTGQLSTVGVDNSWSAVRHSGIYGDVTYQARMRRTGCTSCSNSLWIRGNSAQLTAWKDWKPSYQFSYTNNGNFSVWRVSTTGTFVALKPWTASAAIVKNGWNTLKVVAVGSSLKFYINGVLVYSGASAPYATGQAGVAMYRTSGTTGNRLYVDWVRMATTATADVNFDELVAPGVELRGGNIRQSP